MTKATPHTVNILIGSIQLEGELIIPQGAKGIVVFAHGSGSSRFSPRNQYVAEILRQNGLATLLMDLLTKEEERIDEETRELRFNIPLLADRLAAATNWLVKEAKTKSLPVGYFGASTGAAAALIAAAKMGAVIFAVVSRGGRPDLADPYLSQVKAPTLLIVGGYDEIVIGMNEEAFRKLSCKKKMEIVPKATHLFEEPGALEEVSNLASAWFIDHLTQC